MPQLIDFQAISELAAISMDMHQLHYKARSHGDCIVTGPDLIS